MSDDKNNRGPADRSRINVNEEYELSYWKTRLNCSADELRAAVKAAGPSVDAVEKYLKSGK
ncbi:MAG: DUF3606 domain-containing protein [Polaromonas sp.]|jgi:hypothetical protein|nr:DUF3606 domain-containing protein [Polaromonas sp.]